MSPQVIAIGSTKGGVGKSSLAVNIAGIFAREGRRVVLVDADSEIRSAARWAQAARLEDMPNFELVASEPEHLSQLRAIDCDVVVIDLPGARGQDITELTKPGAVDLFLVPTRADIMDIEGPSGRLLGEVRSPLAVVFTLSHARYAEEEAEFRAWFESQDVRVTRASIRDLRAWKDARMDERLVIDQPRAANAKADLTTLVADIKEMLK